MIGLALLTKMERDGVASIELDKNAYWEEAPLFLDGKPAQGYWAITRGGTTTNSTKGLNLNETIDIYISLAHKAETERAHQSILEWAQANPSICRLSGDVEGVAYDYVNVRPRITSTPQNYAITPNGLVVKVASIEVYYDINTKQEKTR